MATSKVLSKNRLRTMFVNSWKLLYCSKCYFYFNRNEEDVLVESYSLTGAFTGL